ncbi:PAS domain-containing protein [Thalassobaculum litoreum DSM 18839]|uniref:PAS domain-containing protein n=1 Tax=Thalassobaculum litoreum DSM 18839 TaxID=1123362 RepID=A0A8G2F152_9PROT|nr:PAS domain-containing protein [Thalassobaculum litoreum DSM 18839]
MVRMAEGGLWLSSADLGDTIEDPDIRHLFEYWKAAAAGRSAPRRDEIDPPIDLPTYLPTTLMFDVERETEGSLQFRYRLMGTQLVDFAGRELKGLTIQEAFGAEFAAQDIAIYRQVVDTCSCYIGERISMIESRQMFEWYRRVVMPVLGDESGRVDRIWTWITYKDVSPVTG